MKKILVLANDSTYVYKLRKEIISALVDAGNEVVVACESLMFISELERIGCQLEPISVNRHSKSPLNDIKLYEQYKRIITRCKPEVVLTFNIKPNIYGGYVCKKMHIPYIENITGLGTAVEYPGLMQKITLAMYRKAVDEAKCIFFQNEENREFFIGNNISMKKTELLPGSGVNLSEYSMLEYPSTEQIHFLFIARIMKEKGIDEYLQAAQIIKKDYPEAVFHVIGGCDDKSYISKLNDLDQRGDIQYHGQQKDTIQYQKISHCTVLPTYYPEGMNNVLLESAACGRPIITTNRSGCGEIVDDELTGYIVKQQDVESLVQKIKIFIEMSDEEKKNMGQKARKKIEQEFDRRIVVNNYLTEMK